MRAIAVESDVGGIPRPDRTLSAVMLADGRWYSVSDPTLPNGPAGHLSFLQYTNPTVNDDAVLINVAVADIKAVAYHGLPQSGFYA